MISHSISKLNEMGQLAAMGLCAVAAVAGVVVTGLSFTEILPWPDISVTWDGTEIAWAGQALQIGLTVLFVMLALFLPSARRVQRLENSHRRFEINMDDVTRAYRAAHMADRAEMFEMHREFDAVRERYQFLKSQPELGELDAELLTIAAQMSEQTREMAEVYSEAKVARARESLIQRKVDAEALEHRIQQAFADMRELKRVMEDVDIEESAVAAQLQRLRDEVTEIGAFGPEFVRGTPHLKTVPAE